VKDMRQGSMETISHVVGKIAAVVDATVIPSADGDGNASATRTLASSTVLKGIPYRKRFCLFGLV